MKITKMHGLGNDFIITEEYAGDYAAQAKKLCARRLGVGADGLVVLAHSDTADVRMRIFNSDGSEAEMCGNAIRCFARYLYDNGVLRQEHMKIETLAGVMEPTLILENGKVSGVRVDMGTPSFDAKDIPVNVDNPLEFSITVDGRELSLSSVLTGVPHTVLFGDATEEDIINLGRKIEVAEVFPRKTNVNFVQVLDEGTVRMRTWERGAGRTMACGTGACGVVAVAHKKGLTSNKVRVLLEAGELLVELADGHVFMTGPAAYVFRGETMDD